VLGPQLRAAGPVEIQPRNPAPISPEQDPARPRVINGLITSDFPSVGAILEGARDENYTFCTGTLIGCHTFLTAAHCLCANLQYCDDHDVSTGWVYFPNGGVYGISDVHVHPDAYYPEADVAIVTLSEPVTGIAPSAINDVAPVPFGSDGTIVGYGLSDLGWQAVKRMGRITTASCEPFSYFLDSESVCWNFDGAFGEPGENSNQCHGDSGGPMFVDMAAPGSAEPHVVVAGVASGGTLPQCNLPEMSGHAQVYAYRQWIQEVAGDDLGTEACGDLPAVGTPETIVSAKSGKLDFIHGKAVHEFQVPPDLDLLRVTMSASDIGGQTFALSFNHGSPVEGSEADCHYAAYSTHAVCEFEHPEAGTWYATVEALESAGEYELTATMFGNRPNSGKMHVEIVPTVDAVAPGGVLPYTVEIRNVTDQTQTTSARWRIKSSNGTVYPFGPYPLSLAPGQAWTHNGRISFGLVGPMGPGWMSIETTGPDGSFDRDWTTFKMQNEHAVAVRLSSAEAVVRPGAELPYTVELQNILGKPLRASATWKLTDPEGHESVYGPWNIGLAAGQTWKRDLKLGYFPQEPLGKWTLSVETTALGFVDAGSLEVQSLPYGVAELERIEGVFDAQGMSSDGSVVVGNVNFMSHPYIWTEETGVVPIPQGETAEAIDVSDDGSVVMGHLWVETGQGRMGVAARWTELRKWQMLPLVDENFQLCGTNWTAAYDMTPDGSAIVGLAYHDGCKADAFRWSEETGTVLLPKSSNSARANLISDDGMSVAGFDHNPSHGYRRGALWVADDPADPHSTFTQSIVPTPYAEVEDGAPGEVLAMTPNASILAGSTGLATVGVPGECGIVPGGYRWTIDGNAWSDMWGARNCWGAWPLDISADGKTAVGSTGPFGAPVRIGMIWTESSGLVLLEDLLRSLGTDVGDLFLSAATDISADGRKILGYTPDQGGWIITLPDPNANALASRAGTGELLVSGGAPVFLPVATKASGSGTEVPETKAPAGTVQLESK
jgi:hypothetical protein